MTARAVVPSTPTLPSGDFANDWVTGRKKLDPFWVDPVIEKCIEPDSWLKADGIDNDAMVVSSPPNVPGVIFIPVKEAEYSPACIDPSWLDLS